MTPAHAVADIHRRMQDQISAQGGPDLAVYLCPHTPEDDCGCRKPRTGMLTQAAGELGVDLTRSVVIGDSPSDISAALAAGCRAIYVNPRPPDAQCFGDEVQCVLDLGMAARLVAADPAFRAGSSANSGLPVTERDLVPA